MEKLKDYQISNSIEPDSTEPVVKCFQLVTEETFYIGLVVHIVNVQTAFVQYLEKARGRRDYHSVPQVDDVAKT